MYFSQLNIIKTVFLLTVLLSSIIAFGETSGEKKLNLRIGFDLTQGKNGVPSLRIRDFEDTSELTPRATTDSTEDFPKPFPVIRADSFSDSDNKEEDSNQADIGNRKSDDEDDISGDGNRIRSTKGLNDAEFEPEENPSIHAKYKAPVSSESEDDLKRRKRAAGLHEMLKEKRKKINTHHKKKSASYRRFGARLPIN